MMLAPKYIEYWIPLEDEMFGYKLKENAPEEARIEFEDYMKKAKGIEDENGIMTRYQQHKTHRKFRKINRIRIN